MKRNLFHQCQLHLNVCCQIHANELVFTTWTCVIYWENSTNKLLKVISSTPTHIMKSSRSHTTLICGIQWRLVTASSVTVQSTVIHDHRVWQFREARVHGQYHMIAQVTILNYKDNSQWTIPGVWELANFSITSNTNIKNADLIIS